MMKEIFNYIKNDKNINHNFLFFIHYFLKIIYMIIPCYGKKSLDRNDIIKQGIAPSDYIIILLDRKPFKCFKPRTINLDKIIPFSFAYSSFFIVVEKDFYKCPFYIYNLYGEFISKYI